VVEAKAKEQALIRVGVECCKTPELFLVD